MPRDLSAAIRPANSSCNCRAMTRPSMRSAAIVQNLNLLDRDYRRVSPTFIETLFARNYDAETLIAAEVKIGGIGKKIIDGFVIVGADEFVFGGSLDAESAADNAFALNDALGRRFVFFDDRSCIGCCCGRLGGDGRWLGSWRRRGGSGRSSRRFRWGSGNWGFGYGGRRGRRSCLGSGGGICGNDGRFSLPEILSGYESVGVGWRLDLSP